MKSADTDPVRHFTEAWRTGSLRGREAARDGKIYASALHECPRQLQLRYRQASPTDQVPVPLHIRSQIGTAIHDYYLPLLAQQWAADPEVDEVLIDDRQRSTAVAHGPLIAHPDMIVIFTDGTFAIIELKTGNKAMVDAALADEPKRSHLDQCRFGGLLAEQHFGTPMRGFFLYSVNIEDPEQHWAVSWRPWTEEQIEAGTALVEYAMGLAGPEAAPRWFGRHGTDAFAPFSPCLSCEFQSGCLGKDTADPVRAEAAAELVHAGAAFDEQIKDGQEQLAEFLRLNGIVERPKRHKSYVTDVVNYLGLDQGWYDIGGVKRELVIVPGHDRLDERAAKEMIESLGKRPPMRRVAGHARFK